MRISLSSAGPVLKLAARALSRERRRTAQNKPRPRSPKKFVRSCRQVRGNRPLRGPVASYNPCPCRGRVRLSTALPCPRATVAVRLGA